jgi:hypothetical protein
MSLFGFGDIKFDKGQEFRKGPLAPLVRSEFERTTLRYPLDVGNYDKAHYVVFYIREQTSTFAKFVQNANLSDDLISSDSELKAINNLPSSLRSSAVSNLTTGFGGTISNAINSGLNTINQATGGALNGISSVVGSVTGSISNSIGNLFGQSNQFIGSSSSAAQANVQRSVKSISKPEFINTTKLTKDAIALYLPDTLTYNHQQSYDQLNVGESKTGKAVAAVKSAMEAYNKGDNDGAKSAIDKAAAVGSSVGKSAGLTAGSAVAGALGAAGQAGFTAITGTVVNPMLELIYKSPNFRTFQFTFSFYPRDEKEALEVQRIIERMKFHQAPELVEDAKGFLIPPSEFDIKFYYAGRQNPNIPPIATCVLTSIDVNYAPNGWSAYEVPGENFPGLGRTGMPVAIELTLNFQETSYLTKRDYRNEMGLETLSSVPK